MTKIWTRFGSISSAMCDVLRRWISHMPIWKTKPSKAASPQTHPCKQYVQSVTSTSDNATMMKLPVVAKQEMSNPIIHHFKKTNTIQPCTSKFSQFHRELLIVQTYLTTYLPEDELLICLFEKQNQANQHHSKRINACDTYNLLPAQVTTQPWWNYQ